jgi:hypothetical protein
MQNYLKPFWKKIVWVNEGAQLNNTRVLGILICVESGVYTNQKFIPKLNIVFFQSFCILAIYSFNWALHQTGENFSSTSQTTFSGVDPAVVLAIADAGPDQLQGLRPEKAAVAAGVPPKAGDIARGPPTRNGNKNRGLNFISPSM